MPAIETIVKISSSFTIASFPNNISSYPCEFDYNFDEI